MTVKGFSAILVSILFVTVTALQYVGAQAQDQQILIQRIQAGDVEAITRAGESKNSLYLLYL